MSEVKDFDAYFAEQNKEPISFKMFGEVHHLPSSLPAAVVLRLIRLGNNKNKDEEIPYEEMALLLTDILGEKLFKHLCGKGLNLDQMGELVEWVMMKSNVKQTPIKDHKQPKNSKGGPKKKKK